MDNIRYKIYDGARGVYRLKEESYREENGRAISKLIFPDNKDKSLYLRDLKAKTPLDDLLAMTFWLDPVAEFDIIGALCITNFIINKPIQNNYIVVTWPLD